MLPLVLYDFATTLPGNNCSPNPAKTRFILGYKNLPFETVWFDYCDIAPKLKELGAPPNKLPDGSERCTVPALSDPNTGAFITDSWVIAEYLDKTYPEKPVFPNGSKGLIDAFDTALRSAAGNSFAFGLLRTSEVLNERSREYFIRIRGEALGSKFDDWSPEGPKRDAQWATIENNYFGSAKTWYERADGKWLMGDTFSYADILFAAISFWLKRVYRDEEWKRIASLHDGKWDKLLADVEKECNFA